MSLRAIYYILLLDFFCSFLLRIISTVATILENTFAHSYYKSTYTVVNKSNFRVELRPHTEIYLQINVYGLTTNTSIK